MADVYSTRLYAALDLHGNEGYTVPGGYVCVLRDVDIFSYSSGSESGFALEGDLGQVIWYVLVPPDTTQSYQWRGRQVFNPGDIITFNASAGSFDVTASGYLLYLP